MTEAKVDLAQSLLLQAIEQLSGLDHKLGVLQGQNNIIITEQQRAAESRKTVYDKLNKIDAIAATVERIAPLVDKHENTHNQAIGAVGLGKWLWGVSAGTIGAILALVVQWLIGPRPH